MLNQKAPIYAAILVLGLFTAGCGSKPTTPVSPSAAAETTSERAAETTDRAESKNIHTEANRTETEKDSPEAGQESYENKTDSPSEPVYADAIKEGVYSIKVDSSSSMFRVTECELTVKDGAMNAVMTMGGTGYLKVFMGTAENALKADEEDYIPYVETESGTNTFEIPVSALDMGINCSAFSKNKEKWYDRVLVFCSDSLPAAAFADGSVTTVESLELEDGRYSIAVTLEGGSGRASVESPAVLRVEDGKAYATIIWGSPNYDYMKVNDVKFDVISSERNSAFEIPVSGFDWRMPVIADTIAMSEPHEIEYILKFDSGTLKKAE